VLIFVIGALLSIGSLGTLRPIVHAASAGGASGPAIAGVLLGLFVTGLVMAVAAAWRGHLVALKPDQPATTSREQEDATPSR
jgi:hypothetical protein